MANREVDSGGRDVRRWLNALAARERRRLALAVVAGVIATLATLGQLALLARVISQLLVEQASPASQLPVVGAMAGLLLLRALALYGQEQLGQRASLAIRSRVRGELLDHLARLGPGWLAGRHSAALASQLVEQVEALDGYIARFRPALALSV